MNNICVGDIARVGVFGHFSLEICLVYDIKTINGTEYACVLMKNKTAIYRFDNLVKIK